MKLENGIISVEIADRGAELKSAVKGDYEYMWCADGKYWARTSPILFPFVGALKDSAYKVGGKSYPMNQHGFARDYDFELIEQEKYSVTYRLRANEETLKKYPFDFALIIKYILIDSKIKIEWSVENKNDGVMNFSIGAHPAFNLRDGVCYFQFDTGKDLEYHLLNEAGLYESRGYTLKNDGVVEITEQLFDNDALIIEHNQAKEVAICDQNKVPYLKVRFDAELFGLWSPAKKNAPFVCIEPWYGRCDRSDFEGELSEKDYIINLNPRKTFHASYEIELL